MGTPLNLFIPWFTGGKGAAISEIRAADSIDKVISREGPAAIRAIDDIALGADSGPRGTADVRAAVSLDRIVDRDGPAALNVIDDISLGRGG